MPPAPRVPTAPRLQLCFFVAKGVVPLPWVEFKVLLRKSLGDSRVFVYITWSRIRQDSQYQQVEVQDWASHLISNLSSLSSMLTGLQKSLLSFVYLERGSSLWLRLRWSSTGGKHGSALPTR